MATGLRGTGSVCDVCLESTYASIDNKLFTSEDCGHRLCRRCLKQQPGEVASKVSLDPTGKPSAKVARTMSAIPNQESLRCPVCQTLSTSWIDRGVEDSALEKEKAIRQRVLAVYTLTRDHFEATPPYNDYLEQREETIYGLAYGQDESQRRALQEELQTTDLQNQKQIAECHLKERQREEEEIRDIVAKEGVFYEIVSQDYGPRFRYAKTTTVSGDHLVHPLQRQHPNLFVTEETGELLKSKSNLLGGSQPRPIQSGLVYEKILKKQPTDMPAMLRACGHYKERLFQRVTQELWGGLEFGWGDSGSSSILLELSQPTGVVM